MQATRFLPSLGFLPSQSAKIEREPSSSITNMIAPSPIIHSDPDILGGTPVFTGTRVPIKTLLDYLQAGDPLDEFLDHFPSVKREQAIASLQLAKEMLTAYANPT